MRKLLACLLATGAMTSGAFGAGFGLGQPIDRAALAAWDIDVAPDGGGEGGVGDPLVGGAGSLASAKPKKTVGSYWPYATTLFDYIRRAMPYNAPQSLSADDVYAVTAYVLHLNGIVSGDARLDARTLPRVRMPNRDGFVPDPRPGKL
ncbi:cytochrome c [Burkholderia cenocepacia]|uniref:c-type cytochrome n=1 Tax=Burkholderia cenocepacia TaxID=95486 RepID=UPI00196A73E0|nr:cytochrome c [Burkholderia cenocepacia]MBN3533521.1 cytochrome c [Burkholderia cenocepacia]MBR7905869.1 cytochrome c [Burkholderia cenocepacia]MBR8025525.1 cytochrome c [Burkholderia cenocepacia]MBR8172351.1 cytochrome c [Burkholderia cenocepacia]MBR8426736.1 cytochrome c [Burkholderia cenocepacia]